MAEEETGVAAVDRGLSIMAAFREGDTSLSLHDLASRTGLYKSTILRLLVSLERAGCILRLEDGTYHLGPVVLHWGSLYLASLRLQDHVAPILQRLVQDTGESATFYTRQGNARLCLFRVDTPRSVRDNVRVGDILPLEAGAGGKVLLAFPTVEALRGQVSPLVVTYGERDPDAAGLATPVFGAGGAIRGAISLSGPATRFRPKNLTSMSRALLDAAAELTNRLGGDGSVLQKKGVANPTIYRAAGSRRAR